MKWSVRPQGLMFREEKTFGEKKTRCVFQLFPPKAETGGKQVLEQCLLKLLLSETLGRGGVGRS